MSYTPKGYTDQEAIESWLGEDLPEGADVDMAVAVAERIIDAETNRDFSVAEEGAEEEERFFDGSGTSTLYVGQVQDVSAVKLYLGGDAIGEEQYTLSPSGDVKTKITLRYLKFPEGAANIGVTGIWGGEEVPADIHLAATMIATGVLQNSIPTTEEVSSYTVGRYSVTYKTKGPQAGAAARVQDILDLNKRYHF